MKKFGFMIVLPMAAFLFACSDDHFSGSGVRLYTSEFSACLDPRVTNAYDGKVTDVDQHTTNYAFDSFGECESASGEYKVSNGEPSLTLQLMCGGAPANCGIDPVSGLVTCHVGNTPNEGAVSAEAELSWLVLNRPDTLFWPCFHFGSIGTCDCEPSGTVTTALLQ